MSAWFGGQQVRPIYIPITEGQEPPADAPDVLEGRTFEMSLTSFELAALYALKGWQVTGAKSPDSIPSATEILGMLLNLAENIAANPVAAYNTTGRLMAMKDSDFPGAIDLYLYIGNMDVPVTDDEEDPFSDLN